MKNDFAHFTIRFLAALLGGLFLLLLRSAAGDPVSAVLTPRSAAPWELSKLVFWPMALAISLPLPGEGGPVRRVPWLSAAPLAAVALLWAAQPLERGPGVCLLIWVSLCAAALALAQRGALSRGDRSVWLVLAAALAVLYALFTLLPPMTGPFLDPADAAAMAVIPY